ncbi:MAG: NUMOD4 motif-containing HNH endonuclease [Bacteroidetes bacterium]|nr:NUMOD4 motif-containing HNH endonuclease [Bacteroidota bacterium]
MTTTINEKWLPVKGYEGFYEISDTGKVNGMDRMVVSKKGLTRKKGKLIKIRVNNDGYIEVRLSKDSRTTTTFIHILIAKAFIPNPLNKLEVNHINGIKADNRIENLEWCTHSENMKHAYKMGLLKPISKHVIDNCTGKEYSSIKEAAIDLNINYGTFRNYLNGNIKNKTCLEYAA